MAHLLNPFLTSQNILYNPGMPRQTFLGSFNVDGVFANLPVLRNKNLLLSSSEPSTTISKQTPYKL